MQMYCIYLPANHTAKPEQIKNSTLVNDNGEICLYTRSTAINKAKLFNGKIKPYGKDFTVSEVKMVQFDSNFIHPHIVHTLKEKWAYKDSKLDMFICYGNVFDDILDEVRKHKETVLEEVKTELEVLAAICTKYDYVHLL